MTAAIRVATVDDAAAILAIYAPIVRDTAISFELEPPTVAQMQQRLTATLRDWPWLVSEHHGEVSGYVYASQHRARPAYQWSVDVSVYIQTQTRRTGVGRALYTSLFRLLELQGFRNCYAGITLPNAASVGLHETMGFQPVGVYRDVGYKLGAWHDVGWWQLAIQTAPGAPEPPMAFATLQQTSPTWDAALAAGVPLLSASEQPAERR